MPPITSPQAVRFCNEDVRPYTDARARLYEQERMLRDKWVAQGMAALIPDNSDDVIEDGAAEDGRPIITGAMVNSVATILMADIATMEAGDLDTVLQVAVNPGR